MRDANDGYWVVDWKTTMRMMGEESFFGLELDDQVASYCWALRVGLGLNIRGFQYVELRKAAPEPPVENKTIRLGRKYSVSKNQPTDFQTYKQTVMVGDPNAYKAGLYNEFLEWLERDGTKFIATHKIYKRPDALHNIGHNIYLQAREMISDPAIYPSPGRFTCSWCAFQGPCIDRQTGNDYQYAIDTMYEIKPRYYELVESNTDRR
jgi:hypothetical protein